jgi:hypothetical protein
LVLWNTARSSSSITCPGQSPVGDDIVRLTMCCSHPGSEESAGRRDVTSG